MHPNSTLAARQAANFGSTVDAAPRHTARLPELAQRQLAAISKQGPPAHDQRETPPDAPLRSVREAAARHSGKKQGA